VSDKKMHMSWPVGTNPNKWIFRCYVTFITFGVRTGREGYEENSFSSHGDDFSFVRIAGRGTEFPHAIIITDGRGLMILHQVSHFLDVSCFRKLLLIIINYTLDGSAGCEFILGCIVKSCELLDFYTRKK
jgi:hypothetical protein